MESVIFFNLGWLFGVVLGRFGGLWGRHCGSLEVQNSIEIWRHKKSSRTSKLASEGVRTTGHGEDNRRGNRPQDDNTRLTTRGVGGYV